MSGIYFVVKERKNCGTNVVCINVRLWNFKDGGSLNASSLPKNRHAQRKPLYFENTGSTSLSKSAKIELSKSILDVKK